MIFGKQKKIIINFKFSKPMKLSILQTPEGNDSRTYTSIDKSTREAKDIEYEISIPTQRYVNKHHQKTWIVDCLSDI